MGAVLVVRLPRCGAKPHIPIESLGAFFGEEIDETGPEELPAEALTRAEYATDRLAGIRNEIILDNLTNGLYGRSEAVERILEAEPRVEAEHSALGLNDLHNALAFADRAGHRLFAPDILAGIGGHNALNAVPVRRRADMDDVNARIVEKLHKVLVRLNLAPTALLGGGETLLNMKLIRIAKADETRTLVGKMVFGTCDSAETDKRARKLVRGSGRAPENLGRNEIERADGTCRLKERSS